MGLLWLNQFQPFQFQPVGVNDIGHYPMHEIDGAKVTHFENENPAPVVASKRNENLSARWRVWLKGTWRCS